MRIDDKVFVHHPELIGLDPETAACEDLESALHEAAAGATEISILGGYYNTDRMIALCKRVPRAYRRDCRVRIAIGLEATALIPRTWTDMRGVEGKLRQAGFRDILVSVVTSSPVHFHTKLFRILRTTQPIWFIGSANPGSRRHELMVRLSGRHDALSAYVKAVFETAQPVTNAPPPIGEIITPREFFLTGVLCHKPPVTRLFTFDAFRFSPSARDLLAAILAGEAGVEHARPRTEGFGFGLRSALGMEESDGAEPEETVQRIQYRRSAIETVLGLWMPRAYAAEIERRVEGEEDTRLIRLSALAAALRSEAGRERAVAAFADHVRSMQTVLDRHNIPAQPVQDRQGAFARFLDSRNRTLADEDRRIRLSRVLTLTDMPDIWGDVHAADAFETSFHEDLASRLAAGGVGAGRIVRSLARGIDLSGGETPEEIAAALAYRLEARPWIDDEWTIDGSGA
ncbi:hypothetical protein [Methylobacterium sp. J-092]|uniref:hypothetical protein n=1 Tax=Methylobacterium sp. J-092 TaxID=2836667 RepID=UPI001FBB71F8|nr:hypothetical protein [Methylobacterium sp. J-092]MCJ2009576.1 hypothetical protein [Methylobacterium sp. J-092]